jgi:hypothetical protein
MVDSYSVLGISPLHAAGHYDKGFTETVLDRIMSSYSSSVKAIIYGRRRRVTLLASSQSLLGATEHTPEYTGLPAAKRHQYFIALVGH